MGTTYLRKYGVAAILNFELYATDGSGLVVDAAHAEGDTTLSLDEGVYANTTNGFVDEGLTYSITLSTTEMQSARVIVAVVDQTSPQAWLDKTLIIETYGDTSAQHAFDLDAATQSVNLVADQSAATIGTVNTLDAGAIDSIWDEVFEGTTTARMALRLFSSSLFGKLSGGGTNTLIFRNLSDSKNAITATVDSNFNRTAVSVDGS